MNPYAKAAADLADEQRSAVRASVYGGATVAPEQAASAARLSRQAGLPAEVVQRNPQAVQRRLTVDRVDSDTADAPVLRNRYADPTFAALAHDDSTPLSNLERTIGRAVRYVMGAAPGGGLPGDIAAGYFQAQAGAAGVFRAASETAALPFDFLERFPSIGGNPLRRLGEGFGMLARQNQEAAQRNTAPATDLLGAGVSSGVQSATQSLLMAPLALFPGGGPAALTGMSATAGGQSYQTSREAGAGQLTALSHGASDAVIEYATERLPLSRLLGDLKAGTPVLKTVLHQAGADIPGEQIATVLQDLNEWAVLNPDKPFSAYLKDRPSAAAQTLIASVVASGGNVAVMKAVDNAVQRVAGIAPEAQQAAAGTEALREAVQAAETSALRERDPATFRELVEEIQPDTVVYVAPEHLAGVDLTAVPNLAQQVAEASATGGDVQVTLGELLAHLPGDKLLPHLRLTPQALTATEAQRSTADVIAEQIDAPEAGAPVLTSPEQAAMSQQDWTAYLQAAEQSAQQAIDRRDARNLRDLAWLERAKGDALAEIRKQAQAARATIENEVRAELQREPAYAAQHFLQTDEGRGLPPDAVAERFGYSSADAMHDDIATTEPESMALERLVEERMREQHPDIADEIARERSAEALVSDRARVRFLATEAAALANAIGSRAVLERDAQRYAEASIARRLVRSLRRGQFEAAADRAGKKAAAAFRRGDTAGAAKFKREQALQTALQAEGDAAIAEVERALQSFKRITHKVDDGSRDGNLADTARAVLAEYGLARVDQTAADYLAKVQHYDPDLHADLLVLMEGLPAAANWRDLTVADFRAVRDKVDAVWTLARTTRQIEIDGQMVEIATAAQALAERLDGEPRMKVEKQVGTNTKLDLRMRIAGMKAALRRVEFWADARDGGDKRGPFRTLIWQPVSEAVTRYRGERNRYVNRFLELLKTVEPTLKPGKIAAPELADGMVFADRSALLHALLHTGNESNLRKLLLGYQWASERPDGSIDTTRWDNFLRRMHAERRINEADWRFVQETWNLLEEIKPAAQQAHKRMFGHYFAEITAEPVQTPFGQLEGGYVPAITDNLLVPEARTHGTMDDLLAGQNSPMFPAVNRGFTKGRIEAYTRPLALDLRLLPAHIDKVTRFAYLGPALRDAARLVTRNRVFRAAMDAVDPTAVESMLAPWLKRTATQTLNKAPESQADRAVARIANVVRQRTGLIMMSANVVNTLQQITGLSVAALRVQPRYLGAGLMEFLRSPRATAQSINELSPWMQQRSDNGARDVDQAITDLLTNPGALQRAEQAGTRYGYVLQQVAQNFIDRSVWLGAYKAAEARGVSDAQAVREADSAVRMTQSSFAPEDAAKVEHAGSFTRLFLMFYSYFSGQANLLATEAQNANGRAARLALVYLLGFAVPAFLADVIAKAMRGELGGDDDDGDELAQKLLESFVLSQARYAMAMVPVAGQVGNAAIGQFTPERFDDRLGASPAYSAIEATVRAPRSIYRAVEGDGNPKAAVRDGLTALGLLTGLPTGPLVRPLGHLADEQRDDVTLRGLITGR